MAQIAAVAGELLVKEAEAASLAAKREEEAKENIAELLEYRESFDTLAKAVTTVLANIQLSNMKFDQAAATGADLSLEDTEALLANYDDLNRRFGHTFSAVSEEYSDLREELGVDEATCPCGGDCGAPVRLAA